MRSRMVSVKCEMSRGCFFAKDVVGCLLVGHVKFMRNQINKYDLSVIQTDLTDIGSVVSALCWHCIVVSRLSPHKSESVSKPKEIEGELSFSTDAANTRRLTTLPFNVQICCGRLNGVENCIGFVAFEYSNDIVLCMLHSRQNHVIAMYRQHHGTDRQFIRSQRESINNASISVSAANTSSTKRRNKWPAEISASFHWTCVNSLWTNAGGSSRCQHISDLRDTGSSWRSWFTRLSMERWRRWCSLDRNVCGTAPDTLK